MSCYLATLWKARCLRISWIPKLMIEFVIKGYLKVLDLFPVACCLLLRMAWMEKDWNLKKLANFFQILMLRAPKILKKFIMDIPKKHFVYDLSLKVMILAQNWPKTAKSSWQCSFKYRVYGTPGIWRHLRKLETIRLTFAFPLMSSDFCPVLW